jgi:D-alanyl-D-alanine carboxypeptidase
MELAFTPGTTLKYSNVGFALLGRIVSSVTGQPYTTYVTKHIIEPLNLQNTVADYEPSTDARLATAYGLPFEHCRPILAPRTPTKAFAPAVGVHANPEDMCRFASAHFIGNPILLSDSLKQEAQRPQQVATGYDSGWTFGLGFEIVKIGERQVIGHSGHLSGYLSATYFDPQNKVAVAVMANCKDAPSVQIVRGIFEALDWFKCYAKTETPRSIQRLNARLCSPTTSVEIVAAKDQIVMIDPDDWEPFTFCEMCELASPSTLRITTPGSVMNEHETVEYSFVNNKLSTVRCAGVTLLPEALYRERFGTV